MPGRISAHIRSNVYGLLALFLVLTGGTAQALNGSNTVFTDDIVNQHVRSADVADDSGPFALQGNDIAANALTGDDIAESSLAQVPSAQNADNANTLGGQRASDLTFNANLQGGVLRQADLRAHYFHGARAAVADFTEADLSYSDLSGAFLNGTDLTRAKLERVYAPDAFFDGANMTGANMSFAVARGAEMKDVNLTNANLTSASLTGASLLRAFYDVNSPPTVTGIVYFNTTCPDGTNSNSNVGGTCAGHGMPGAGPG